MSNWRFTNSSNCKWVSNGYLQLSSPLFYVVIVRSKFNIYIFGMIKFTGSPVKITGDDLLLQYPLNRAPFSDIVKGLSWISCPHAKPVYYSSETFGSNFTSWTPSPRDVTATSEQALCPVIFPMILAVTSREVQILIHPWSYEFHCNTERIKFLCSES